MSGLFSLESKSSAEPGRSQVRLLVWGFIIMTPKNIEQITAEWVIAFNSKDIDRLLRLYHDNAKHYSPRIEKKKPETRGWLEGKAQFREWWEESFRNLPDLEYRGF